MRRSGEEKEKLIALFNFSEFDKVAWINEEDGMYKDLISRRKLEAKGVQIPAYGWLMREKWDREGYGCGTRRKISLNNSGKDLELRILDGMISDKFCNHIVTSVIMLPFDSMVGLDAVARRYSDRTWRPPGR